MACWTPARGSITTSCVTSRSRRRQHKMDLCIYHSPCYDGFTAAWVVRQAFPDAKFIGANYGDEPPDVRGKEVIVVDFSYPRDVLERMHEQAKSLLVLDHHKSAEKALEGLYYAKFDMSRSGAMM